MVRNATLPQSRPQLDPGRILAISVSIAVNVAMLALLMRPLDYTPAPDRTDPTNPISIVKVKPVETVVVKHELVVKPHVQQVLPHVVQRVLPTPVISHNPVPIDVAVNPNPPIDPPGPIEPNLLTPPVETSLMPIASPAPTYPRDALREGITGTVELELLVGVDGSVIKVQVTRSSGNHQLDEAARDQVLRNWRFQPALRNGIPVQALGRVPIVFTLDGR